MNDFIREIQEDIEREKWALLWEKYGRFLTAAVVAIVVAAGGWQVYNYQKAQANMQQTASLASAMDSASGEALMAAATELDAAHRDVALLALAQMHSFENAPEKADAMLADITKNAKADARVTQDLAAALRGDASSSIFAHTALERSGWQAVEQGDYAAAAQAFDGLRKGERVPASMMERAKAGLTYSQLQLAAATPADSE